jgi:hypothetical protein
VDSAADKKKEENKCQLTFLLSDMTKSYDARDKSSRKPEVD